MSVENLITEHLDIWTSTIKTKSTAGRGSSNKLELVGVKKLRELILELAVRGKLVPQDPNDEPASVLLKRIEAEKARLVKEGKIKKQKPLPFISDDEKPFEVPLGWEYRRLDDICAGITSGSTPAKEEFSDVSGVPYLKVYNIKHQQIDFEYKQQFVSNEFHRKKLTRSILFPNDVIMNIVGPPLGKVAVIPNDFPEWNCNQAIVFFRPLEIKLSNYIYTYLKSGLFLNNIELIGTAGQDNISVTKSRSIVLPTPPLEEQHLIVAKVDELMALCDQLETQTESSIQAHQVLVETLLATLSNAKNADELNDNWQTISQHFDVLFTTQDSIDQLKQTILQLAVMGKLVKQDPNDEPAAKLLERIATEKEQLIKDGKIKKQKPLPPITDEEKPFELPEGWEFIRFGDLTSRLGSGSTPRGGQSAYVEEGIIFLRSQNVWNDGLKLDDTTYISEETNEKMANTQVFPGDVLLNITGASLGRSTIFPENLKIANVSQHVTIIRLIEESMSLFVHLAILSPLVQRLVWGRQVGMAIEGLSKKVLELFEFPVPPIEEQQRIIAKVDALMALCDSLKAKLNEAQTTHLQITEAIVEQAL